MGEDDERTARDVRRLQALVGTVAAELGGRAGRRRAIAARSESVLSALQAVVPCRSSSLARRRPSDSSGFGRHPLRRRAGRAWGTALGDAINVAVRLCTLARPGTVCVRARVLQRRVGLLDGTPDVLTVPRGSGAVAVRGGRRPAFAMSLLSGSVVGSHAACAATVLVSTQATAASTRRVSELDDGMRHSLPIAGAVEV